VGGIQPDRQDGAHWQDTAEALRPALRCAATSADPWTGDTSIEVPGMMRHYLGHMFCGIYAKVLEGGDIFEGDHLRVVEDEPFNPHVPCRPMRRTRCCGRAWRSCSDHQTASTCCRAMTAGRFCQPMPEPASSCIPGLDHMGDPVRSGLRATATPDGLPLTRDGLEDLVDGMRVVVSGPVPLGKGRA
jgi:hypothetical protein